MATDKERVGTVRGIVTNATDASGIDSFPLRERSDDRCHHPSKESDAAQDQGGRRSASTELADRPDDLGIRVGHGLILIDAVLEGAPKASCLQAGLEVILLNRPGSVGQRRAAVPRYR